MRTTILLLMLLGATRAATAGDDVGVIVTGEATLQPQLSAQVEEWLRNHGHKVVAAPLPVDAINTMIDCFVIDSGGDRCARGVVDARARTSAIVFAKVEVAPAGDGMRNIKLTAYWFEKKKDVTARIRTCERCTDQTLRSETDTLMTELAKSRQRGSGMLRITSTPPGAKVIIDDDSNPVGVTPLDYNLTPGNHEVTLVLDRHEIEQRPVAIRVGDTTPLNVPLVPVETQIGRLRPLPIAFLAGGALAVATGVTLLVIDEDASASKHFYRDTAPAGYVVTAAGGIALGVGAWLWFRTSSSSDSAPVVSASDDGAYLGWAGRF